MTAGRTSIEETELKLIIAMFSYSMRLQYSQALLAVGIHVCYSANWEQSHKIRAEWLNNQQQMKWKDAWVVVAIMHLIRTEVSIQSEQTQEVIPSNFKTEKYYTTEKICNKKKWAKSSIWDQRGRGRREQKQVEGQKQKTCVHTGVLLQ